MLDALTFRCSSTDSTEGCGATPPQPFLLSTGTPGGL